jgi:thioredoxin 1
MSARWPKLSQDGVPQRGVVLLDFYQASCAPCRALEPRLEAFARRHAGELRVLQVDVDEDMVTPQRFGVQSLPTLIVFRDGDERARLDGRISDDDLDAAISGGR